MSEVRRLTNELEEMKIKRQVAAQVDVNRLNARVERKERRLDRLQADVEETEKELNSMKRSLQAAEDNNDDWKRRMGWKERALKIAWEDTRKKMEQSAEQRFERCEMATEGNLKLPGTSHGRVFSQ